MNNGVMEVGLDYLKNLSKLNKPSPINKEELKDVGEGSENISKI
jgi:hypothetical protein